MAIKTKKISDLTEVTVSQIVNTEGGTTDLDSTNFYLLGCKNTITGKVSTASVVGLIRNIIDYKLQPVFEKIAGAKAIDTVATASVSDEIVEKVSSDVCDCKVAIQSLDEKITDLNTKYKNYAFSTTSHFASVEETIATLTERVIALEGFVQALQADGYLTLANIKKAAAEACPICTHTHEEEQPTE